MMHEVCLSARLWRVWGSKRVGEGEAGPLDGSRLVVYTLCFTLLYHFAQHPTISLLVLPVHTQCPGAVFKPKVTECSVCTRIEPSELQGGPLCRAFGATPRCNAILAFINEKDVYFSSTFLHSTYLTSTYFHFTWWSVTLTRCEWNAMSGDDYDEK